MALKKEHADVCMGSVNSREQEVDGRRIPVSNSESERDWKDVGGWQLRMNEHVVGFEDSLAVGFYLSPLTLPQH